METCTISVTLWGDGLIKGDWLNWYNDIGIIFQELGYKRTHIEINSKSYANDKVVTVARKEKAILHLLQDGEEPISMSCLSLNKDYRVAAFDYNVMAARQREYISLILNQSDVSKINIEEIILRLKQYIEFDNGEVYQMDRQEVPLFYAAKLNPIECFESLVVLKKF